MNLLSSESERRETSRENEENKSRDKTIRFPSRRRQNTYSNTNDGLDFSRLLQHSESAVESVLAECGMRGGATGKLR